VTKPNPDIWNPLLDQMKLLHELKPWQWLREEQVFGVHDPDSDTVGYVSVLGAAGQIAGVVVYPGTAGWSFLARLMHDEIDDLDGPYSQDAVTAFLIDRDELRPDAYKLLRALGRRYRGRGAWPEVSRHRPGLVPALPDDPDLTFLSSVLGEAIDVCRLARAEPKLLSPRRELLVRRAGRDTREKRPEPLPPAPIVTFDEIAVKRLSRLARCDQTWVGDHFLTPAIIDDGTRPAYFARGHVWIDGAVGTIIDMDLADPDTGDEQLRSRFVDLAGRLGLPARVIVRRASLADAFRVLEPPIEVIHDPAGELFHELRDKLQSFLGRCSPPG